MRAKRESVWAEVTEMRARPFLDPFVPPSVTRRSVESVKVAPSVPACAPLLLPFPFNPASPLIPPRICDREADHSDGMQRVGSYIQHNLPDQEVETYKCVRFASA